jgi:hypothetical protein
MSDDLHLKYMGLRQKGHQRNTRLDELLKELAQLLEPVEREVMKSFTFTQHPVLFLAGCPRSGSTVFTQFLQSTGQFAIPTNIMSRFYYAPFIGAKIQQLLFNPDYDFRGELSFGSGAAEAESWLGKTKGPLAPSEMLHFWRRFLPHYDPQYIAPDRQAEIDTAGIAAELAAIESVFQQPVAMKSGLLLYNLRHLRKCADSFLMLHVTREPVFIAQSLLLARENHYGRRDLWWSAKPREYDFLKDMDPYHQVAGQVYFTLKYVESEMHDLPEEQRLTLSYESFCKDPGAVYRQIVEKYAGLGCELNQEYRGPDSYNCSRNVRLTAEEFQKLEAAYSDFAESRIGFSE